MPDWLKKILRSSIIRYFEVIPFSKGKDFLFRFANKHSLFNQPFNFRFKGVKVLLDPTDFIQNNIFFFKVYERWETALWLNFVSASPVIFDVGANIGYYSLLAAKYSKGRIYSFEPVTRTYERLKQNLELNCFSRVTIVRNIVSDNSGMAKIYLSDAENTGMSSLKTRRGMDNWEEVEKISLDDFVDRHQIKKLGLVKIDVEGNEMHVIRGMDKILDNHRPVLFIEVLEETLSRFGIRVQDVFKYLFAKKYRAFEICGNLQLRWIDIPKEKIGLLLFLPEEYKLPKTVKLVE